MTDRAHESPAPQGRLDLLQVLFWSSLAVGIGAGGVAVTAGPSAGRAGAILLILLAATGLVLFVWLSRGGGRRHGAFPERGAIEAFAMGGARPEFLALEALDEPALVTDRALSPLAANQAYAQLAADSGTLGESDRPPAMNRMFGADPLLSAPMFRLARAAQAGQSRREELPVTTLGGLGQRRFEASVSAMPGGHALWRLREIAIDARDSVEDAAAALFLEDAPIGFFACDAQGGVSYMNRALRAVLGHGEEGARLKLKDFVKEDAARLARKDRRGFGAARSHITLRARDGAHTSYSALTFAGPSSHDGLRALVFLTGEDAAPQQAAARTPVDANFAAFEHAPIGAALLDGEDLASAAILDANPALMEITQGRAAPGAAFAHLFDASDGPEDLTRRLQQAVDQAVDLQIAAHPPVPVHVQCAASTNGRTLAYVVSFSEQRELEQRLAQSEKMREIGMLAGGVAHDFNNLLEVVMQNCDYLLRRHPLGDPDYLDLTEINLHAVRARELSEMLRAYARQQTFKREILDPAELISNMQELLRRLVGSNITFDIRHGANLPLIRADRAQLERVLVNLCSNARDAMNKREGALREQRLTVRTGLTNAREAHAHGYHPVEEGEYALIEVEDTGHGIRSEEAAKVFHPFHTTKDNGRGTGLGLATSYGIIKQSGGYIFFSSVIGKGTTFRIYLPVYEPTAEEREDMQRRQLAALTRSTTSVAGRGRILLADDLSGVRKAIARNLVDCGFEVVQAGDGEEALEELRREPGGFDLIISDVSMPVMTGPEMLREAGPELIGRAKVLFLSGYAPESFEHTLQEFPVSFMSKPVGMAALAARVKELLALT
jgi:two-component system cell cycle sensor histidine kinase/response regulator CckA